MKVKICVVALLLLLPIVYAQSDSIKLLAVAESDGKYEGSLADLHLTISPGIGRVYIESYPLSKIDTQFSTRLAKDVACRYSKVDCNRYDFFYTIKASTSIIGGPSAGAATALLTISLLNDLPLDKSTTITGTINSGGIIGPVGMLLQKIDVAAENNLKKVLIPYGAVENGVDVINYGKSKGVEVIEVSDIDEALYYFTGKETKYDKNITVNSKYASIMKNVASLMCNRSMEILEKTLNYIYRKGRIIPSELLDLEKEAAEYYVKGQDLFSKGKYYSAASQCFGANVRYREFDLRIRNLSKSSILFMADSTLNYLLDLDKEISEKKKNYLSDLETYMIVKERIVDAKNNLEEVFSNLSIDALSYAIERANSASMWSNFFQMKENKIDFNKEVLKDSCIDRLTEVRNLYEYISLLVPDTFDNLKKEIIEANDEFNKTNYELCLFKASKVKANLDVILSGASISTEQVDNLIKAKINAARRVIIKENQKGIFPIIGYSYYEYADSLKEDEKYLALVYAEYGLELSNLDIYLKKKIDFSNILINFSSFEWKNLLVLILGIIVGIGITLIIIKKPRKKFKGIRLKKF